MMEKNLSPETFGWRGRLRAFFIWLNAFMEGLLQEADTKTGH
jgi:hypothetical protein